jgi:hypothetical protein
VRVRAREREREKKKKLQREAGQRHFCYTRPLSITILSGLCNKFPVRSLPSSKFNEVEPLLASSETEETTPLPLKCNNSFISSLGNTVKAQSISLPKFTCVSVYEM